jgi:hypothetical protein
MELVRFGSAGRIGLIALLVLAGCGGGKSVSSIRSCLQQKHLATTAGATASASLTGSIMVQAAARQQVRVDVFSKAKDAQSEYRDFTAEFGPSGIGKGGGAKQKGKTVVAHPYRVDSASLKTIEGCAF